MRRTIRAIVFNSDDTFAAKLRSQLLSVDGVHLIAEVDDPAMLGPATAQFPCDVLIAHLDPGPEANIRFLSQVAQERSHIPVFAISACSDGQVILNALRAGVREYLTKPVDLSELEQAIDKVAQQAAAKAEPGRIIAIMNSIGGGGSSTIAVNLAVEMALLCKEQGRRVAVVDLDYKFGQIATMLDAQPQHTIADLCDSPEQIDQHVINRAMLVHRSGVHVLARPNHFGQAELITAAHCASVMTSLQDTYDYVIIDGPTRFDVGAKSVLDLASLQLMVIQLTVPSVRNVHRILEELQSNGYNLERVKIICNRVGKDSGYLESEHVEATLGRDIFASLPDDWKTVSAAVNMGIPLSESAPKSRIRQAYVELAQRVYEPARENGRSTADAGHGDTVASARKPGNLLSKIFSS